MVDGWLAQALANRSGHYADPTTRTAAVDSLPAAVRAHAALLASLARTGTGASAADSELEFAGHLAQADPDATAALASWLERARSGAELGPREPREAAGMPENRVSDAPCLLQIAAQDTIERCPACGSPRRLATGKAPVSVPAHQHEEQAFQSSQSAGALDRRLVRMRVDVEEP